MAAVLPSLFLIFKSAPALTSSRSICTLPWYAACIAGVQPSESTTLTASFVTLRARRTSVYPLPSAMEVAVS
eukprot:10526278-Ditylum_brightwellii.AAC.1